MNSIIDIIKGIHPGIILDRELKKRKLQKGRFAMSIDEYPQTIVSITKGNRRMNPKLSLKIETALGIDEGFFLVLQAYHDVREAKREMTKDYHPDLSKIRSGIFWDTKMNKMNWLESKGSIIRRVFERGNEQEIKEIIRFYGKTDIEQALNKYESWLPTAKENAKIYL